MIKKVLIAFTAITLSCILASAQPKAADYKEACDSISKMMKERTGVTSVISISRLLRRGKALDFYFSQTLSDYPWKESDIRWFREQLESLAPESASGYNIGAIFANKIPVDQLSTPPLGNNGSPTEYRYAYSAPTESRFVEKMDGVVFDKGLEGRNIAIWQSHGRYYNASTERWAWMRAPIHTTVEDLFTQTYVLKYIIPMLERAGAYVLTPRERDTNSEEVVIDNDASFPQKRGEGIRKKGIFSKKGNWTYAGLGFADSKIYYTGNDNPFLTGTAIKADCTNSKSDATATATWTPNAPSRGSYAVYISYKSLPNSSTCAHYTINHLGGKSEFIVNQRMGGGTWVYLGEFEFGAGEGSIVLDNATPAGRSFEKGSVVSADAVRIGGGMGKIARGGKNTAIEDYRTSGLPAYAEAAVYSLQWAGIDSTVTRLWEDDYTQDLSSRGAWVRKLTGGSSSHPAEEGLGIPVDMSLGFHTDAGVTPNDSTIGSLAIYTLLAEGSRKLDNGNDRITARMIADQIQSQVCNDLRKDFDPDWSRRELWDRSYSESRTTGVPGVLFELLSHQNFSDMKYGLDPDFQFEVGRAVYKGILKSLSNLYSIPYIVQPLPVSSLAVDFKSEYMAEIKWQITPDDKEPTALPKGFILYTRIDDGGFDDGMILPRVRSNAEGYFSTTVGIEPGHIYSFKVEAYNEGGRSFPSEVLCLGRPKGSLKDKILIVNNFDRLAAPSWYDFPEFAGFDRRNDCGVGYIDDLSYVGDNFDFRRNSEWINDDAAGLGASFSDKATKKIAGNSFDYVYIHGKAVLEAGEAFCSQSRTCFATGDEGSGVGKIKGIDLICGKQVTTSKGRGTVPDRYRIFTPEIRDVIKKHALCGRDLLVSGAYIGTDIWDSIYPVARDSLDTVESKDFARKILGYTYQTGHPTTDGKLKGRNELSAILPAAEFQNELYGKTYPVQNPDGISPATAESKVIVRYATSGINAGIVYRGKGKGYTSIVFGFPLESLTEYEYLKTIISWAMDCFNGKDLK